MSYTPPAANAANFTMASGYLPPAANAADFSMVEGGGVTYVGARAAVEHSYSILYIVAAVLSEHGYAYRYRASVDHPYRSAIPIKALSRHAYASLAVPRRVCVHAYAHQAMYRTFVNHSYAISDGIRTQSEHSFGYLFTVAALSTHPYADQATVRKITLHEYAPCQTYRALSAHRFDVMASNRTITTHDYSMIAAQDRAAVQHLYDITDVVRVRVASTHFCSHVGVPSIINPGLVQSVTVAGQLVDPISIDIAWKRSEYVITGSIELATSADYQLFKRGQNITVLLHGDEYLLTVESKSRRRSHGSAWTYTVHCLSPAALILASPYAPTFTGELTGMASVLAAQLGGVVPINWSTVDWFIPPATWNVADQDPLELLRTLAAAAGSILVSERDGSLTVEAAYVVPVPEWGGAVPSAVINEVLDIYEAAEESEHRAGYNRYLVSDQMTSSDSYRMEDEVVDENLHYIRVYQTPWINDFTLRHTGGDWVFLEDLGTEERQETEIVEFVAGEARTAYPIYGVSELVWKQVSLGTVITSEDGRLASSIDGESLAEITYTTRARKWAGRDSVTPEQVQFITEDSIA